MPSPQYRVPIFLFLLLPALASCFPIYGASDEDKGVVAGGVVFNIASDRQVKSIGGIVQPEALDLYLKRRFDGLNDRLDSVERKVDSLIESVHGLQGNRTSAAAAAAPAKAS